MRKVTLLPLVLIFVFFCCGKNIPESHMELLIDKVQDGYVSNWSSINAIAPPPPAPFKYQGGTPIDFSWVNIPQTGRAAEIEVDFFVAMGNVGKVHFHHIGSAQDVATSTARIKSALNTWNFSNNASGEVILKLNFGKNEAEIDYSKMQLLNGIEFHKQSFRSAFRSGTLK